MNDREHKAVDAMARFGGGFVSALALAWRRADSENQSRLREAFPELIEQYSEIAADPEHAARGSA